MEKNQDENSSDTLDLGRGWRSVSKEAQELYKEKSREEMIEFINNFGSKEKRLLREEERLLEKILEKAIEFAIELSEDPHTWPRDWRPMAAACVQAANVELKAGRPKIWVVKGFSTHYVSLKASLKRISFKGKKNPPPDPSKS